MSRLHARHGTDAYRPSGRELGSASVSTVLAIDLDHAIEESETRCFRHATAGQGGDPIELSASSTRTTHLHTKGEYGSRTVSHRRVQWCLTEMSLRPKPNPAVPLFSVTSIRWMAAPMRSLMMEGSSCPLVALMVVTRQRPLLERPAAGLCIRRGRERHELAGGVLPLAQNSVCAGRPDRSGFLRAENGQPRLLRLC